MKIATYSEISAFTELQSEWNPLLERSVTNVIFNTWEWHKYWWEAFQPGELWLITLRDDSDTLRGIAPFFLLDDMLYFAGCEDVTDYLDIIVDTDFADAVYEALAAFLTEQQSRFKGLDFCNIPQNSPTLEKFKAALARCQFEVTTTPQEVCPLIELPDTYDAYLENLDSKQQRELRRKMRKADAQRERGIIDWYIVDETHDIQAEIDTFLDLMRKADPEKATFLEDKNNVEFFKTITPIMLERGWLQLAFITVNGEPAAAYLNYDYQNCIYVYNSGLDAAQFGRLSPGIVLLVYLIQHAIEQDRAVFDFLRGNEGYKYRMGATDTAVFSLRTGEIA